MATEIREKMLSLMKATIADEHAHGTWTYHAVRPLSVPVHWFRGLKVVADCSKGCQYLARWAGAPDPMGMGFSEWGNSTTMTAHLAHLDHPSELDVGDYVTFGPGGDKHAACVMEKGNDPLLWSHGHQGAPNSYRLSADRRERHFLRNPVPHHVKTKAERLRAMTGYWSWLQWTLGEGNWRGYGSSNKTVRPNVPKRIPLKWWRMRAKFILVRKRGANKATT